MTTQRAPRSVLAIALVIFLCFGTPVTVAQRPSQRPRLVLLIVVDQFRYDYLQRFSGLFGPRGIKRLMNEGAFWTNANFDFIPTKTAPGHTAIVTGAPPAAHGIVGNEWLDRTAGKVTSVTDAAARVLGGGPNESAYSPRRLLASTVGDELRVATNDGAKVIGISDKARAAILTAGRRANAAYWLSSDAGNVISSDYYFKELPEWVNGFNRTRPLDKYFGARWERLLPEAEYLKRAGPDSPPWENIGAAPGFTNAFPHTITGGAKGPGVAFYDALDHSPFVNEVLLSLTERAIEQEQLGQDLTTDLLTVSLSGSDHVGHRFGPYSQEVMDMTLRVDQQIARLLDFVDERVGLKNTLVVFTSDHGVSPLWDQSVALGRGRGHIIGKVQGEGVTRSTRVESAQVISAIRSAIRARYGRASSSSPGEGAYRTGSRSDRVPAYNLEQNRPDPTIDYILTYADAGVIKPAIINGNVYFNLEALKRDGMNLGDITQLAGEAALKVPGIARYFTRAQIEKCRTSIPACPACVKTSASRLVKVRQTGMSVLPACAALRGPIGSRVLRGFYPERSGDLVIVQKPFHYLGDSVDPANHGSPYSYDTHVPLIIMGTEFKPGRHLQPATPADIAPTLSTVLQIRPPNKSQGRILREALAK
jgi:predicted AlkP superfamily pyrophosphatase or phosphodiesterase